MICPASRLRVYLDTSVISYLYQEDSPKKMLATRELWKFLRRGEYDLYLSTKTINELEACNEEKRRKLIAQLDEIKFATIKLDSEIKTLASRIVNERVLSNKSMDDAVHIAAAVTASCDCILSWNFKHMVNTNTIAGVRRISNLLGYDNIDILSPQTLLDMINGQE